MPEHNLRSGNQIGCIASRNIMISSRCRPFAETLYIHGAIGHHGMTRFQQRAGLLIEMQAELGFEAGGLPSLVHVKLPSPNPECWMGSCSDVKQEGHVRFTGFLRPFGDHHPQRTELRQAQAGTGLSRKFVFPHAPCYKSHKQSHWKPIRNHITPRRSQCNATQPSSRSGIKR